MAVEKENTLIEQIQELKQYLSESTNEELEQILKYWEEVKARWEREKQEFWENHDRKNFKKLLRYKWRNKEIIERQYKYLDMIKWLEREKFIEEYLHNDILYGWKLDETEFKEKKYSYTDWKEWNVVMKEWAKLNFYGEYLWFQWAKAIAENLKLKEWVELWLGSNDFWDEWAKAISEMELEEWVQLHLWDNKIWVEWIKAIAQNMKLKEWVELYLNWNIFWAEWIELIAEEMELKEWVLLYFGYSQVWDEWAKAISKIKLKEWVELVLYSSGIWDEWAEAIMKNMVLKGWVKLNLMNNKISDKMKIKLKEREKFYNDKWIKCIVEV